MADQAQFSVRGGASHSRSIGITQRATPLALAWTGDQRVRFSDFQVNEIGKDGKVVHLSHIGAANGQAQASEASRTEKDTPESTKCVEPAQEEQTKEVSPEDVAILSGLAGDKFANDLVQFYQGGSGTDGEKTTSVMSEPMDDKSKRAQIHGEVRRIFKSTIETSTDASGAILATRVSLRKGKKRGRGARELREDKPTGEYLHFTIYKDNRDTMDAVNQIARVLRIKPQSVGYAGTKDRRASTAQRCSVRHVRQRALAGCSSKLWGIETGDYEYRDESINLGQLLGNEFVIVIKNCKIVGEPTERTPAERLEALKTQVQAALDLMASRGWINYFGHQRFGTYQIGTHEIGKLIIGGKWEDAVMALLSYDEEISSRAASGEVPAEAVKRDQYARHHACMLFKTGQDPEKAAKIMPGRFAAESCIVRHLTKPGTGSMKDYGGALTHITRGLRSMYLHAYQSHVWNHAASRRWELHGDKVVQGDLVIAETEAAPLVSGQDQDGDDIVNPVEDGDEPSVRARPLTEEEASSGRYTIHDVVLPLPGYDVVYPDNEIGDFYQEFMAREENGGLDPHNMRRLRREFSLPGRYRKLMSRFLAAPSVDFRLYSDDVEQMHPTDLDLVRAARKSGGRRKRGDDDAAADGGAASKRLKVDDAGVAEKTDQRADKEQAAKEEGEGDKEAPPAGGADVKVAAVLKFQLGSSAYATVVLRELMGDLPDDTNADAQAQTEAG
ncbi:tRNA pseudouridine synthase D (TruD) domain-containing protein [Hirsutella rhossiliensis]|uniref:tRNA pseudouridine synthase D (TruD) domain-containing protein n=1 Tax=Hirsutella rhossiliensis TaxID=111463 RepID=A0A9P8SI84_9HYPO|nr:tRNA pseudouridine synthase D (TruD) domain-containing protein [Hirsutella rhossiliensis]KAH0962929.1 tRNA pseudouridine synthase D (TruD) domain-containing protein [Hirsutella rhossiliensis]